MSTSATQIQPPAINESAAQTLSEHHEHIERLLTQQPFLTDSGLETTLVFHDGLELPCFAAFTLLQTDEGRDRLRTYYREHMQLASSHGAGFILEAPTWRANPDWALELNLTLETLAKLNHRAIADMKQLQMQFTAVPSLVSGCLGPRGDGYSVDTKMSIIQAQDYHGQQIEWLRAAGVDLISAMTLNYVDEAIGIVAAANAAQLPVVISFTVETDGLLPDGTALADAIAAVDAASEQAGIVAPLYYMINCAHPQHFKDVLGGSWLTRVRGVRANASTCSHAELDAATELDAGHPEQLGLDYRALQQQLPALRVYGGCCGTDMRHIREIASACLAASV